MKKQLINVYARKCLVSVKVSYYKAEIDSKVIENFFGYVAFIDKQLG